MARLLRQLFLFAVVLRMAAAAVDPACSRFYENSEQYTSDYSSEDAFRIGVIGSIVAGGMAAWNQTLGT
jgi:hypothetical protein